MLLSKLCALVLVLALLFVFLFLYFETFDKLNFETVREENRITEPFYVNKISSKNEQSSALSNDPLDKFDGHNILQATSVSESEENSEEDDEENDEETFDTEQEEIDNIEDYQETPSEEDLIAEELAEEEEENELSGNFTRLSEKIANEKISSLLHYLGTGRGPFIIGGIGDSGTRGVYEVLAKFGVYLQSGVHVVGNSKDSIVFMATRWETLSSGRKIARNPSALYNEGMRKARSLKYNSSYVRPERWQVGRQWVADMIMRHINFTEAHRIRSPPKHPSGSLLYPFGFKHPRTSLLLPYWYDTLGKKFAFIHVIRDGREVSHGDNQRLFMDHCNFYYGVDKCKTKKPIEMWADLNKDVFDFVLESNMNSDQYFAIRIEDLVSGDRNCYESLLRFLNPPNNFTQEVIEEKLSRLIKTSKTHRRSYFGLSLKAGERAGLINLGKQKSPEALSFWGYSLNNFTQSISCTSLPWIKILNEKKQSKGVL